MSKCRLVKVAGRENWHITWSENGEAKRKSTGSKSKAEANAYLEDFLIDKKLGGFDQKKTIGFLVNSYIDDRQSDIVAPETLRYRYKNILPYFGDLLYRHLSPDKCRHYCDIRRNQNAADSTIRDEIGLVATALNHALRNEDIDKVPNTWRPPASEPRERYLTKQEARRLLIQCEAFHLRTFVLLALSTAARTGAILDLTWDRVDFEKERIDFRIPGKKRTNKRRAIVPINYELSEELKIGVERATSDYVIEWGGKKVDAIKGSFKTAVRNANLDEDITPHTLRHTAATWMANTGVSLWDIKGILGHSSIETTQRVYAHHTSDYLENASSKLSDYVGFVRSNPVRKRLKSHIGGIIKQGNAPKMKL